MTRVPVSWRLVLVVAAGYAAGSITSFVLFESSSTGAVLFLPAGVTFSALVLSHRRRWPWILATAALVEVAIDRTRGIGPVAVWGFALANTAEPLVGATLFRRFAPKPDLSRGRHLGGLLFCDRGCRRPVRSHARPPSRGPERSRPLSLGAPAVGPGIPRDR